MQPRLINRRYRLEEELGRGEFGVVYKAYDTTVQKSVAIKIIHIPRNCDAEKKEKIRKRFEREANALAALRHLNIAEISDTGRIRQSPFLVFPYLTGGTLAARLGSPSAYTTAAQTLIPIAKALAYAHKKKFIHRDIKPSNILFTDQGDPVLADFGLAKSLDDDLLAQSVEGGFTGTFLYAAPEQLEGRANYQSDIYSLGVIFYQMITGHIPFQDNWVQKFLNPYPEKPSSYVPDLPGAVDEVILLATARDLESRFDNMDLFADKLEELATSDVQGRPSKALNYLQI
ncbi:MAG TPA: serine/threonine-protein kinase, partial [Anaerolineales bacterium]|nr:serine/threonine-protein kinase [Anaerolineales bacterium]